MTKMKTDAVVFQCPGLPPFELPDDGEGGYIRHCPDPSCAGHTRFFAPYWRLNEHMKTDHGWPRKTLQPKLDRRKNGRMRHPKSKSNPEDVIDGPAPVPELDDLPSKSAEYRAAHPKKRRRATGAAIELDSEMLDDPSFLDQSLPPQVDGFIDAETGLPPPIRESMPISDDADAPLTKRRRVTARKSESNGETSPRPTRAQRTRKPRQPSIEQPEVQSPSSAQYSIVQEPSEQQPDQRQTHQPQPSVEEPTLQQPSIQRPITNRPSPPNAMLPTVGSLAALLTQMSSSAARTAATAPANHHATAPSSTPPAAPGEPIEPSLPPKEPDVHPETPKPVDTGIIYPFHDLPVAQFGGSSSQEAKLFTAMEVDEKPTAKAPVRKTPAKSRPTPRTQVSIVIDPSINRADDDMRSIISDFVESLAPAHPSTEHAAPQVLVRLRQMLDTDAVRVNYKMSTSDAKDLLGMYRQVVEHTNLKNGLDKPTSTPTTPIADAPRPKAQATLPPVYTFKTTVPARKQHPLSSVSYPGTDVDSEVPVNGFSVFSTRPAAQFIDYTPNNARTPLKLRLNMGR